MAGPRRSQRLAERKNSINSNSNNIHTNRAQVKSAPLSLDHSGISVPQEQGPKPQTSEGTTAKLGSSIIVEISGNMIRVSQHCVLYRFPPEIRKEIFKAAIDLFFQEFPRGEDIRYHVDGDGLSHKCPLEFPIIPPAARPTAKVFAGLYEKHLPALEAALFPDTTLHGEFITTRIEKSTLALIPALVRYDELGPLFDSVLWPRVDEVSPNVGMLNEDQYAMENVFEGSDAWDRMSRLGNALNKLLVKAPTPTTKVDSQANSLQPKSGCELLPRLQTVIIRFPDTSLDNEEESFTLETKSYKPFHPELKEFLKGLQKFVSSARVKSLQLEDLRDFGYSYDSDDSPMGFGYPFDFRYAPGLMNEGVPRFRKFTTSLNKAFGIVVKDETDFDHLGSMGWEVYKAKETWTAEGDFLVWKD